MISIDKMKEMVEAQNLSQKDFETFVERCGSESDYECFLECALDFKANVKEENDAKVMKTPIGDNYYSEEVLEQYFHEIGFYPILTKEQEKEIVQKAQSGDEEARETLVTSNLKLVAKVALKYSKSGTDYIDLIQEGTIGLIKAIDKYDDSKGHGFSAYAIWWIKREIINSIANKVNAIKIPNYIYLQNRKIKMFEIEFLNSNGKAPTYEEISTGLGIEIDEVKRLKEAAEIGVSGFDEGAESYLGNLNTVEKIDKELDLLEEKMQVSKLLKKVSTVERRIIEMYFGLDRDERMVPRDISKELGISVDKVKLIKDRALVKLKYAGGKLWE